MPRQTDFGDYYEDIIPEDAEELKNRKSDNSLVLKFALLGFGVAVMLAACITLLILEFEREVGKETVEGALKRSDLANDKFYNVGELGAKNGELVLYIDSDIVTNEKAAEILLKTKELMDQSGISFYSVELCLRHPPYDAEKSYERPDGEIRLEDFLYADIYEEGLVERVAKCAEDTQNYYNEQDKAK